MEIKKNIVLLGMMGSGKSTIGGLLAKKLNSVLIDIDKKIEKMQNLKISEIFKTKGEAYFRELEFNVTLQSLDGDNNIISLGGGAFMNKELRKVLKQKSSTFWLHWNADTLIKRIKNNDKRPIIKGLDNVEIKKLINERNKIYYFSDFKIICESLKKTEIVDKIIKKCKKMKLFVKTKDKKYPIYFSVNSHINIKKILIKNNINPKKLMVVYDKNVPKNITNKFKHTLKKGENIFLGLNVSEKIKNLNTVKTILDILGKNNFNRNDSMICIGGGIAGDICAFAASIYKRGLKFVNIPTTLLSQVDSSIGGKTGINNFSGKNMIGTFCQPNVVITDITFLKSLPKREMICGYAEILKHALISDKKFFIFLKNNLKNILNLSPNITKRAIFKSCKIKKNIVERDEREINLRKTLNYGHTFAHAFESTLGYTNKLNHGEAVLLGILVASKFSNNEGFLPKSELELIEGHIKELKYDNLKKYFNKKSVKTIVNFMARDKKNYSKNINLILLKRVSKPLLNNTYPKIKIEKFLNTLINK